MRAMALRMMAMMMSTAVVTHITMIKTIMTMAMIVIQIMTIALTITMAMTMTTMS